MAKTGCQTRRKNAEKILLTNIGPFGPLYIQLLVAMNPMSRRRRCAYGAQMFAS